jgi:hypothetical protein
MNRGLIVRAAPNPHRLTPIDRRSTTRLRAASAPRGRFATYVGIAHNQSRPLPCTRARAGNAALTRD